MPMSYNQRKEREVGEIKRRMDDQGRQNKEEARRSAHLLGQLEKRLNEHWSRQIKDKEVIPPYGCKIGVPLLGRRLICVIKNLVSITITAFLEDTLFCRLGFIEEISSVCLSVYNSPVCVCMSACL